MWRKHRRDMYKRNTELMLLENRIHTETDESRKQELVDFKKKLEEETYREKFNYGI